MKVLLKKEVVALMNSARDAPKKQKKNTGARSKKKKEKKEKENIET